MGILIFLLLAFLVLYILNAPIMLNVKNDESLKIEIHFPIFALHLTKRKADSEKSKEKSQKSLSALAYISIISKTLKRFGECGLIIRRIVPPQRIKKFTYSTLVIPYGYQSLIYSLIAYLRTNMKSLVLLPGAVEFIPDNETFILDLTLSGRLYRIAYGAFCLYKNIRKEKRLSFGKQNG